MPHQSAVNIADENLIVPGIVELYSCVSLSEQEHIFYINMMVIATCR